MQPERPILQADNRRVQAFTVTELVVVVAVLALLALCLLPALARTNPDTRAFQCLNNHRQLARAWRMYADDNNDKIVETYHGATPPPAGRLAWVQGWLDWGIGSDNTN